MHEQFKSYYNFICFSFFQKSPKFPTFACGVFIRRQQTECWRFALRFCKGGCIWSKRLKTPKIAPFLKVVFGPFLVVFRHSLKIHSTQFKSRWIVQIYGLLLLNKHTTLPMFKAFEIKKNLKLSKLFKVMRNLDILFYLSTLEPYIPSLFYEKRKKIILAVINTYF